MIGGGRWFQAAGEGALAGWIGGAAIGSWAILLNEDLAHGMFRLAAGRLLVPVLGGAIVGALVCLGVEAFLELSARRGRRPMIFAILILGSVYAVLVLLAGFPLRPWFFPLRVFSGRLLSIGMFAIVAGAQGAMLAGRIHGILSDRRSSGAMRTPPPARPAVAAMCGAILTALGAAAALASPWFHPARPRDGRSVILLSLDTLRADRVGFLGCPRPLTPRLDALSREGMVFEQAESSAPWTLPSHATIFSSLLPFDHGARWDQRPLRPSAATLAEHFLESGFRTASFNGGGYVSAHLGLSQGFEIYEEHDEGKDGGPERIATAALEWVRSVRDAPFFLFLHTYVIHLPYTHSEMANPADAGSLSRTFEIRDAVAVEKGEKVLTPGERRYVSGLYDGGVAHADLIMGGFLDTLRREGILDRAILVVLSDHGEDLWDHDATLSPGHGHSLYEELLHVPLFFRAPGVVQAGGRVRTPVGLIDVAPTVLALAGLPTDPQYRGRNLVRILRSGSEPEPEPIMAESTEYGPDRFSLRRGDLKVVLTPLPDQANSGISVRGIRPLEVFDLAADPAEKSDLSARKSAEAAESVRILWGRVEKLISPSGDKEGEQRLPEDLKEQLRSLGYVH